MKRIITLETAILVGIGSNLVERSTSPHSGPVISLAAGATVAFFHSIAAAALLLLSLPQIAQQWRSVDNWRAHEDRSLSG